LRWPLWKRSKVPPAVTSLNLFMFVKYITDQIVYNAILMKTLLVSTYVPQKCGIATYTRDLIQAVVGYNSNITPHVVAIINGKDSNYPPEVKFKLEKNSRDDYIKLADRVNSSSYAYVCIQHEYGIFGGNDGDYILDFAKKLKKPLITTFHTTLLEPSPNQKHVLKELARLSQSNIVMIKEARARLRSVYNIPSRKIKVIHHGVPDLELEDNTQAKERLGFRADDFLVGTINLISRNKGLEYVIDAVKKVSMDIPKLKFVMVGATHPQVKRAEGESYREFLLKRAFDLNLNGQFKQVNEYVPLNSLVDYLKALDVYITPYTDLDQTSSGTLAYAVGAGKICISTPYIYANEILSDGRGFIVPRRDSDAIAEKLIQTYTNLTERKKMQERAYKFGRKMIWSQVAAKHIQIFKDAKTKT